MLVDSNMPTTIGTLRATVSEKPLRIRKSEKMPPSTPPTNPHTAGNAATKPALRMDMPRSLTRYTGNHVRKKYVSVVMQYWLMYTPSSIRLPSSCLTYDAFAASFTSGDDALAGVAA